MANIIEQQLKDARLANQVLRDKLALVIEERDELGAENEQLKNRVEELKYKMHPYHRTRERLEDADKWARARGMAMSPRKG
jgi:regulator of replication initiation timing